MKFCMHASTGLMVGFETDEDGWFIAHVPDLPGCVSQGANWADVCVNIHGAICDYLEIVEQDDPKWYAELISGTSAGSSGVSSTTNAAASWDDAS